MVLCCVDTQTGLYAYYGYQLSVVNSVPYFEVSSGDGSGGRPMIWITMLGFLIFLSRAVYVFLAAFDIGLIELGGNNGGVCITAPSPHHPPSPHHRIMISTDCDECCVVLIIS